MAGEPLWSLRPSAAARRAPVICPICPENDDVEGRAVVGWDDDYPRSYAGLERFSCPNGHTERDLGKEQTEAMMLAAVDWLVDEWDALDSLANDQRIDSFRDER